jgi:head-tail adaptor
VALTIGDYPDRLVIVRPTVAQEPTYGQAKKSYADGPAWWGKVEEGSGAHNRDGQDNESRTSVTITLTGRPVLSTHDRVRWVATGFVYQLEGVSAGIRETVCTATRLTEK